MKKTLKQTEIWCRFVFFVERMVLQSPLHLPRVQRIPQAQSRLMMTSTWKVSLTAQTRIITYVLLVLTKGRCYINIRLFSTNKPKTRLYHQILTVSHICIPYPTALSTLPFPSLLLSRPPSQALRALQVVLVFSSTTQHPHHPHLRILRLRSASMPLLKAAC